MCPAITSNYGETFAMTRTTVGHTYVELVLVVPRMALTEEALSLIIYLCVNYNCVDIPPGGECDSVRDLAHIGSRVDGYYGSD